jgi:phosphoglycolate phosphatase
MSTNTLASFDAYLFDLDGTLVDTAPDINAALNFCLQRAGMPLVEEALTRHWVGHGAKVLIQQALQHQDTSATQAETMLPSFLEFYSANLAVRSRIYPEVTTTLATLRARGAKLAVVTNKITDLSLPLLEQIGLIDAFDLVVCGDTASAPKPDPAPVQYCLDAFGIAAHRSLFVGDSATDVDAARAAGMPVACVRDGYNHGVDVTTLGATEVIDSIGDICRP